MEKNKKKLLENFIIEFLPPTGNKRKYSGNELDYITRTLDKVFIQNFGFNLSKEEIADCFSRLNYEIFDKIGILDYEKKRIKPAFIDESNTSLPIQFIYFEISPKTMRQLMLTTSQLSEITNSKKTDDTEKMKIKLELFKNKITHN
ncbi:hypothetical protein QO200_05490 [Flavobacterium sp. Arc3]|uniref:hypothetical protein n=1 Tax=Flavobacterium sp. Arc3 TaxID=3046686 RepID=UPI00352D47DD